MTPAVTVRAGKTGSEECRLYAVIIPDLFSFRHFASQLHTIHRNVHGETTILVDDRKIFVRYLFSVWNKSSQLLFHLLWCEVRCEKVLSTTRLAAFFWTSKDFLLLAIGIKYEWRKLRFTLFCRHYWAPDCWETVIKCHIPNLLNLQTMPAAPLRPLEGSDDTISVRFRMFLTPMTFHDYPRQPCPEMQRHGWIF